MGGCASRPKDLDLNEPAPVPVEAPVIESEAVTQENNGCEETKSEEPLVDLSEANETAELKPAKEVAETKAEENVEEAEKTEAEAEAAPADETPKPVEEAKEVEPEIIEDKADAPLAPIA